LIKATKKAGAIHFFQGEAPRTVLGRGRNPERSQTGFGSSAETFLINKVIYLLFRASKKSSPKKKVEGGRRKAAENA
jgi:hypothetical protein